MRRKVFFLLKEEQNSVKVLSSEDLQGILTSDSRLQNLYKCIYKPITELVLVYVKY